MKSSCPYACYRKEKTLHAPKKTNTDKIEIVFFDMDGVLTNTLSSWKYIHDFFGTSNKRSVDAYLKGTIDDLEFIKRDVALWKEDKRHAKKEVIQDVLYQIPLMQGAKECISYLHNHGVKTAIVSAGLDILAEKVAQELGIDYVFANGVQTDEDGRLTGEGILRVQLVHKEKNVQHLATALNIPLRNCAAVGNSCFDIPMFETCGIGIAFNPEDECVRKSADIVIEGKNLLNLVDVLKQDIE